MLVYNHTHIHHSCLQQVAIVTTIEHLGYVEQCKEIWEGGGKESRLRKGRGGGRRGKEGGRGRRKEGKEGGEERGSQIQQGFSSPLPSAASLAQLETTALRLSWRLQSHTRSLSTEQEVPLS